MSSYPELPKRPMAMAQYKQYSYSNLDRSNLRDSTDRFGSPAMAVHDPFRDSPRQSRFAGVVGDDGVDSDSQGRFSKLNPKRWTKKTWIIVVIASVIILIAIIVGAVEGVKANAYPSYTPLSYSLTDTYQGSNFFSNFQYWDTYDPAQGFVHYDNPTQSAQLNTTFASATSAVLRVDNTEANAVTGRHSARVSSIKTYNNGLFIFDILHSPYGCATWPAVWLTDQYNWPNNGEIDVIEAVNQATSGNEMTLHTTSGCSMSVKRKQTGTSLQNNCYNGTDGNAGCGVSGPINTYGSSLNSAGGGVYAMELRSAGIRMWFFPRNSIPADITASISPAPQNWGEALADFPATDCNIGNHFGNLSIVANIDVCGSWAGATNVYSTLDSCPGNCTGYAAENPAAFDNAYWEFASFKVYSAPGA